MNAPSPRLQRSLWLAALCAALCACSGESGDAVAGGSDESPAQKLLKSVPFTKEGLATLYVKTDDKKEFTPLAYEALLLGAAQCERSEDKLSLEKCPPVTVLDSAPWKALGKEAAAAVEGRMLQHPNAQVRMLVADQMAGGFFGIDKANIAPLLALAAKEADTGVLGSIVSDLGTEGNANEQVGAFLLQMSKNADAPLRTRAIRKLTSSWNDKVPGRDARLLEVMETESDPSVLKDVCKDMGETGNEALVPAFARIIEDAARDAKLRDACAVGLANMWWDFPFHETYSEKAYRLSLQLLKQKPRSKDFPGFSFAGHFNPKSDQKFSAWLKKASWYKPAELRAALADIVKDEQAYWMSRTGAVGSMVAADATKAELQKLLAAVKAQGEQGDNAHVIREIEEQMEKAK